jgi:peptidyl-Asp metalloendopeptidase
MKMVYALLFVLLTTANSYGQQALFKPVTEEEVRATGLITAQRLNALNTVRVYKSVQYIRVGDIKNSQKKGKLTLMVPNALEPVEAKAIRVEATDASHFKWFGETDSGQSVLLISQGDTVFGHIALPNRRYNIVGLGKKLSALAEIDPTALAVADCSLPESERTTQPKETPQRSAGRLGPQACINPIRILLLSTQAARVADPNIGQTARTAVDLFNSAVYGSQIGNLAVLEYAGYVPIEFGESPDIGADINKLATQRPDVEQLRVNARADLVFLLTNNNYTTARGRVQQTEASRGNAYALGMVGSAANDYTLAHEVGHLFGGGHENDNSVSSYAHGKRFDVHNWPSVRRYSTLMHTWPSGANYSRVTRFSNPNVTFEGVSTGDEATANVTRKINERMATVADFEPSPNMLSAYISGRTAINYGEVATWEAVYSCGSGPYSFQWAQSYDGFDYSPLGTGGETYTGTLQYSTTYLRVIVTSSDGQVAQNYITISVYGGGSGSRVAAQEPASGLEVIYPNPTDEQAQVQYSLGAACGVRFELINGLGQTVQTFAAGTQPAGHYTQTVSTTALKEGKYVLRLLAADVVQSKSLLILRKK